jgi:hypothetical protein
MGLTGFSGAPGADHILAKKKKKKKKKNKKKPKPAEYEDPSLREHLLAGAYGGVAKIRSRDQVSNTRLILMLDSGTLQHQQAPSCAIQARK